MVWVLAWLANMKFIPKSCQVDISEQRAARLSIKQQSSRVAVSSSTISEATNLVFNGGTTTTYQNLYWCWDSESQSSLRYTWTGLQVMQWWFSRAHYNCKWVYSPFIHFCKKWIFKRIELNSLIMIIFSEQSQCSDHSEGILLKALSWIFSRWLKLNFLVLNSRGTK